MGTRWRRCRVATVDVRKGTEASMLKRLVSCYVNFAPRENTTPRRWDAGDGRTGPSRTALAAQARPAASAAAGEGQNVGLVPVTGAQQSVNPSGGRRDNLAPPAPQHAHTHTQPRVRAARARGEEAPSSSVSTWLRPAPRRPQPRKVSKAGKAVTTRGSLGHQIRLLVS